MSTSCCCSPANIVNLATDISFFGSFPQNLPLRKAWINKKFVRNRRRKKSSEIELPSQDEKIISEKPRKLQKISHPDMAADIFSFLSSCHPCQNWVRQICSELFKKRINEGWREWFYLSLLDFQMSPAEDYRWGLPTSAPLMMFKTKKWTREKLKVKSSSFQVVAEVFQWHCDI